MNSQSMFITIAAIVGGVVLVALGHGAEGAVLLSFATGVALFKPVKEGF